jgi:DNA-binding GntR family transcriptional regulator
MKATSTARTARSTKTTVDRIYHEIQDRILYRVWGDGHQVLEQELAAELGVSRTPVREALVRLQRDGLIKVIPRHGMRVLPLSPTDVREIYQILSSLESLAVVLAAARRPAAKEFEALERANRKMKTSHEASDFKAWTQADEAFHYHLVELSGNRILTDVHENFWSRAQRARLTMLSLISPPARSTQEHALLLEAIRHGDGALARERLEAHLEHIIAYVNNLKEPERSVLRQL